MCGRAAVDTELPRSPSSPAQEFQTQDEGGFCISLEVEANGEAAEESNWTTSPESLWETFRPSTACSFVSISQVSSGSPPATSLLDSASSTESDLCEVPLIYDTSTHPAEISGSGSRGRYAQLRRRSAPAASTSRTTDMRRSSLLEGLERGSCAVQIEGTSQWEGLQRSLSLGEKRRHRSIRLPDSLMEEGEDAACVSLNEGYQPPRRPVEEDEWAEMDDGRPPIPSGPSSPSSSSLYAWGEELGFPYPPDHVSPRPDGLAMAATTKGPLALLSSQRRASTLEHIEGPPVFSSTNQNDSLDDSPTLPSYCLPPVVSDTHQTPTAASPHTPSSPSSSSSPILSTPAPVSGPGFQGDELLSRIHTHCPPATTPTETTTTRPTDIPALLPALPITRAVPPSIPSLLSSFPAEATQAEPKEADMAYGGPASRHWDYEDD
ncbi:hypothetical protein P7C73_g6528, partial [Tremellales sp. Uapishka_1]